MAKGKGAGKKKELVANLFRISKWMFILGLILILIAFFAPLILFASSGPQSQQWTSCPLNGCYVSPIITYFNEFITAIFVLGVILVAISIILSMIALLLEKLF
jgi:hypothetical protein